MKEGLFHSNQFWHTVDEAFPILIATFFFQNCFGFSKEVSNSFLTQGAKKWQQKMWTWSPGRPVFMQATVLFKK